MRTTVFSELQDQGQTCTLHQHCTENTAQRERVVWNSELTTRWEVFTWSTCSFSSEASILGALSCFICCWGESVCAEELNSHRNTCWDASTQTVLSLNLSAQKPKSPLSNFPCSYHNMEEMFRTVRAAFRPSSQSLSIVGDVKLVKLMYWVQTITCAQLSHTHSSTLPLAQIHSTVFTILSNGTTFCIYYFRFLTTMTILD